MNNNPSHHRSSNNHPLDTSSSPATSVHRPSTSSSSSSSAARAKSPSPTTTTSSAARAKSPAPPSAEGGGRTSAVRSKSPSAAASSASSGPSASARAKVAAYKAKALKQKAAAATNNHVIVKQPQHQEDAPAIVKQHQEDVTLPPAIDAAITVAFQEMIERQVTQTLPTPRTSVEANHPPRLNKKSTKRSPAKPLTVTPPTASETLLPATPPKSPEPFHGGESAMKMDDAVVEELVVAEQVMLAEEVEVERGLGAQFAVAELGHDFTVVARTLAEAALEIQGDGPGDMGEAGKDGGVGEKLAVETVDPISLPMPAPLDLELSPSSSSSPAAAAAAAAEATFTPSTTMTTAPAAPQSLLWTLTRRVVSLSAPTIATVARVVEPAVRRLQSAHPRVQMIVKYAVLVAMSPVLIGAFVVTWPFLVAYRASPGTFKMRVKGALGAVVEEYRVVRGGRLRIAGAGVVA
ncbi:hypothetical protein HDU67_010211 [Dinochytrium kinnereticum]|nr:hypothetical protein HDU67_010211 [Dinochytrium kinnereticum]